MTITEVQLKRNFAHSMGQHKHLGKYLESGFVRGRRGWKPAYDYGERAIMAARSARGFNSVVTDMLTPPSANDKLEAATVPSYGLTLAHEQLHEEFNLCPWAGDCVKVCVLNNGNGRYQTTQRAWLWRTDFLAHAPTLAVERIGWELGRAVHKHGEILFRPDVNSDLTWHRWLPELGSLPGVTVYGYTKNPAQLHLHERRTSQGFNYAYSHNESSDRDDERRCLSEGGKIAVVTSRKKGDPVDADALRRFFGVDDSVRVVDADVTDEWMLPQGGIIGDLSAKGKARQLIGVSDFVVRV
jgi:hypothetical protein